MPDALNAINLRTTPQSQPADPRQVPNSAGGYTFTVAPLERLRRFLVLGHRRRDLLRHRARADQGERRGRARAGRGNDRPSWSTRSSRSRPPGARRATTPRCSRSPRPPRWATPRAARLRSPRCRTVARTGTHLFLFAGYIEQFRGWGRGLRRAVADWYLSKPVDAVAYQAVKYRQREGWSHRDLLRLAHPATDEARPQAAVRLDLRPRARTARRWSRASSRPSRQRRSRSGSRSSTRYPSLSWEMLPDAALGEADGLGEADRQRRAADGADAPAAAADPAGLAGADVGHARRASSASSRTGAAARRRASTR